MLDCLLVCLMVLNATFNNISVISWRSVLLVEISGKKIVDLETGFLRIFFWRFIDVKRTISLANLIRLSPLQVVYKRIDQQNLRIWRWSYMGLYKAYDYSFLVIYQMSDFGRDHRFNCPSSSRPSRNVMKHLYHKINLIIRMCL